MSAEVGKPGKLVSRFLLEGLTPEYLAMERYHRSFVYVIQWGDDGPVKIGCAAEPSLRLLDLQCGNWRELHLRAAVPCRDPIYFERLSHALAAKHNIRGEWFDMNPIEAVEVVITALALRGEEPLSLKERVGKRRRAAAHYAKRLKELDA